MSFLCSCCLKQISVSRDKIGIKSVFVNIYEIFCTSCATVQFLAGWCNLFCFFQRTLHEQKIFKTALKHPARFYNLQSHCIPYFLTRFIFHSTLICYNIVVKLIMLYSRNICLSISLHRSFITLLNLFVLLHVTLYEKFRASLSLCLTWGRVGELGLQGHYYNNFMFMVPCIIIYSFK